MFKIELLQPPKFNIRSGGYFFNSQISKFLENEGVGKIVEIETNDLVSYISNLSKKDTMLVLDSIYFRYIDFSEIRSLLLNKKQKIILLLHLLPSDDLPLDVAEEVKKEVKSRELEWIKESDSLIIVTGKNYMLELVKKGVDPSMIKVVTPGQFKLEQNKDIVNEITQVRYPIKGISIGSICDRKNQILLLNMLSKIDPLLYKWTFIGSQNGDQKYLRSFMDEIEKIKWEKSLVFLGNIQHSKVLQTLSVSDLFVSISTKESYGMAVAEACSTGVPVLALETGDISDWVKQNYNGFIFPQEDSQGLQDKLNQIIKDLDLLTALKYEARKLSNKLIFSSWEESGTKFIEACKINR